MFAHFIPHNGQGGLHFPAPLLAADHARREKRHAMDATELKTVLRSLDQALSVYHGRDSDLTPQEIGLKNMLSSMRGHVIDELLAHDATLPAVSPEGRVDG